MTNKNNINKYKSFITLFLFLIIVTGCGRTDSSSNNGELSWNELSQVSSKQVVFLGDSITQNLEEDGQSYPDIVSELTGVDAHNFGFGGTSLSTHPAESFDAYSFTSLTNAISTGDFTQQREALSDPEIPEYFEEKLTNLESINWDEIDIVVVMYGANDWGKPIENPADSHDTNTFLGAGRTGVETILEKHPHVQFLFVPSIYRFWPDFDNVDSDTSENILGIKPYEYSEAIEELADEYNFPSTDTLDSLGINEYNRLLYFNDFDGTHPNALGTEKLGRMVAKALLMYY